MCIAKNVIKPNVSLIPIDCLNDWLKLRHKRLSKERLQAKFEEIKYTI